MTAAAPNAPPDAQGRQAPCHRAAELGLPGLAAAQGALGLSIPNFWLGIMLILFVSVRLGWLPASGYVAPWDDPVRSFQTILMPAFVPGTGLAAALMRNTRSAMLLGVLKSDFVRTARG